MYTHRIKTRGANIKSHQLITKKRRNYSGNTQKTKIRTVTERKHVWKSSYYNQKHYNVIGSGNVSVFKDNFFSIGERGEYHSQATKVSHHA